MIREMRFATGALLVMGALSLQAAEPAAMAEVLVDSGRALGPIRLMNAVNNGPAITPVGGDQKRGNFNEYKAARIPFARTHDSVNAVDRGSHCCDITAVFPNFDADETKPENYDFVFTDHYLDSIHRSGAEIFFRLGQSIEHGPKKYGALPPRDFAKWARICEHVIRHYNEGWGWGADTAFTTQNMAWSNQFNIVYWEIWNEPDLDAAYLEKDISKNPRTWGGTVTNYFQLYEVASKHLKAKFPKIKIGGPAVCGLGRFARDFITYCRDTKSPLDFFSWHFYSRTAEPMAANCRWARNTLDELGFTQTESILNEWNYVKGWGDDFVYTLSCESGVNNLKGAAYVAAVMAACQDSPLDMLMYYDAIAESRMNMIFDRTTLWPRKGYYPFYAWSRLRDYGTQVECRVTDLRNDDDVKTVTGNVEKKDIAAAGGFRAVAARGRDGRRAIFVVRYSDDDNSSDTGRLIVRVKGEKIAQAVAHVTDSIRSFTEVPLLPQDDGSVLLFMQPLSFALIEF